jgi:hypothetical protein
MFLQKIQHVQLNLFLLISSVLNIKNLQEFNVFPWLTDTK